MAISRTRLASTAARGPAWPVAARCPDTTNFRRDVVAGNVYATSGIAPLEAALIGTMAASVCVLVFRGWMLGTFINGNGFKIVTLLATHSGHWRNSYCVEIRHTTWAILGIPIALRSRRVVLSQNGGPDRITHVYCGSIDGIFSSERLDVLFQLLRRWSIPE